MYRKSHTCTGKLSGKPLTEYPSEEMALNGAAYALRKFGNSMVPYRCDACGWWHLAPADRQTPSSTSSSCRGRNGQPKATYDSESDARRRAEILEDEQGVRLQTYRCDCGGWHLTKG